MGRFDAVHTGRRCGQTKALGRRCRDLVPGDRVVLHAVDALALSSDGRLELVDQDQPRPEVTSFQVQMHEGGFLQVIDGRLVDWLDAPKESLPRYSNYGHPLDLADAGVHRLARSLAAADLLDAGIETPRELALDRFLGRPTLEELRVAGSVEAVLERERRMVDSAVELRRLARGLPGACQVCDRLQRGDR